MLSLADGEGWASVIMTRGFAFFYPLEKVIKKIATKHGHIDFIFPGPLYPGAGSATGLPPWQVIYSFDFVATFNIVAYP